MLKSGIIVFAYNRSRHLQAVLNGLQGNEGVKHLYIFHDGLKCEEHRDEWLKTRNVIENITWCEKTVYYAECNKGLANSIVEGVTAVLKENDTVIVLEDDCVPAPGFITFMKECFEKYKCNDNIYCISGYGYPLDFPDDESDIYLCGRISSWGWGTWKERWDMYSQDYTLLQRINADEEKSKNMALWGSDLEAMLVDRVKGVNNSWAVFWALHAIENNGMTVYPYESFIENIGTDGSGVHCGQSDKYKVNSLSEKRDGFVLPEVPVVLETTKKVFAGLLGSYTAVHGDDESDKEKAVVYGLGHFFRRNEKEICDFYNIVAFVDYGKKGWFAGKKILTLEQMKGYTYDKVIVMLHDLDEAKRVKEKICKECNVSDECVLIGRDYYE